MVEKSRDYIIRLTRQIAHEEGLPPSFAIGVMMAESGGRLGRDGRMIMGVPVSRYQYNTCRSKRAVGPFQLMADTAKELGVDREDLYQNIRGGIRYLKNNLELFGGDLVVLWNITPKNHHVYIRHIK